MKVDKYSSVGATTPKRGVKPKSAAGGDFSRALAEEVEAPSVGATRAPAPTDGLLALQEVPDAVAGNARARRRGEDLLDRLDELRLALLTGRLSAARIQALSAMVAARREQVVDPALSQILDEIELRAAVELAKLGH